MGHVRNHTIVCTSVHDQHCAAARQKALELFDHHLVSPIVDGRVNGCASFFIAPDGSKEGWHTSDEADSARAAFKEWLEGYPNLYIDWVELYFGGDDGAAVLVEDKWSVLDDQFRFDGSKAEEQKPAAQKRRKRAVNLDGDMHAETARGIVAQQEEEEKRFHYVHTTSDGVKLYAKQDVRLCLCDGSLHRYGMGCS